MEEVDVIVVGGSVAGSVAAAELGAAGKKVLLLEKETFPRDKACGEGVMPAGAALLAEWGIHPEGASRFNGLRFRLGDKVIESPFPKEQQGLCLRRNWLDARLLDRARSTPNVTVREGVRVTGVLREGDRVVGVRTDDDEIRAELTLGCDGARSLFHGNGIKRTLQTRQRYGIVSHVKAKSEPVVELIFLEGGQLFIGPSGADVITVTLLLEKEGMGVFAGRPKEAYRDALRSVGRFGKNPELTSDVLVAGPLGYTVEPLWQPGLMLVGDSAGFFDPITGEGMSVAMHGARLAARTFLKGRPFKKYAAGYGAMLRDVTRLTGFLLQLTSKSANLERAMDRLGRKPELLQKLLGIASGAHRWADVSLRERLYLGTGI